MRDHRRISVGLAVGLALCLTGTAVPPLHAQQAEDRAASTADEPDRRSEALEGAATSFALAWSEGASPALLALMSPEGVRIQLEGAGRSGLSPRQAVASVGEYLRPYQRGGTTVTRASVLESSPDRGFAEVRWSAMAVGTTDGTTMTVFVGMNRLDGVWKVDEIRILP